MENKDIVKKEIKMPFKKKPNEVEILRFYCLTSPNSIDDTGANGLSLCEIELHKYQSEWIEKNKVVLKEARRWNCEKKNIEKEKDIKITCLRIDFLQPSIQFRSETAIVTHIELYMCEGYGEQNFRNMKQLALFARNNGVIVHQEKSMLEIPSYLRSMFKRKL